MWEEVSVNTYVKDPLSQSELWGQSLLCHFFSKNVLSLWRNITIKGNNINTKYFSFLSSEYLMKTKDRQRLRQSFCLPDSKLLNPNPRSCQYKLNRRRAHCSQRSTRLTHLFGSSQQSNKTSPTSPCSRSPSTGPWSWSPSTSPWIGSSSTSSCSWLRSTCPTCVSSRHSRKFELDRLQWKQKLN